ncbi:MAG: SusC/RagA family TonB-linked outer membrane protein, partial [Bacteroidales bacterium]|nr:SusC/RagA family TonB-linked outer membrane protein [Bacteroidales bacterium]
MKESVKALLPILRSIVRLLLTVVLLFHVSTNAFSQGSKTITGNVIDSYGESLIGVSVAVKGTTVGTVTDYEGNYKLDVPVGSKVLSFSYMGMKPIDIPLEGQTQINVTMEEESLGLDEVVVIGYGVQKKSDVTGAISSVKAEDLANLSTASAASAMQGKVSGVQVINTSGAPGSASTIRIRGFSSNGISEPLYIVDGLKVPGIDYLDAGNIESIEILKDGASAAIYGAEAGNGVVLVTTKTGKKGQGKIFFNTQNSFSSLARKIKLLNAHDFITYALEANPNFAQELDMFYYNDPSSYVNNKLADTDWQDEFFSTGYKQRYTVGFQGGSDKGSLYISLNYLDHDGIITGSQDTYKRISGQLNADYKIKSWFDAGVTTSIETSKYKQVGESSVLASVNMMYLMDPLTPVEYSD